MSNGAPGSQGDRSERYAPGTAWAGFGVFVVSLGISALLTYLVLSVLVVLRILPGVPQPSADLLGLAGALFLLLGARPWRLYVAAPMHSRLGAYAGAALTSAIWWLSHAS